MNRFVRICAIVVLLTALVVAFGCSRTVVHKGSGPKTDTIETVKTGPPPHAPAHGYRHKHNNKVVLVYDSGIGVYIVSGYKDIYFHKNSYYRLHKNKWQSSHRVDGPWRQSPDKKIPPGLKQHVAEANSGEDNSDGKGKDKDKNKGNGKGKDKNK